MPTSEFVRFFHPIEHELQVQLVFEPRQTPQPQLDAIILVMDGDWKVLEQAAMFMGGLDVVDDDSEQRDELHISFRRCRQAITVHSFELIGTGP